MLELFTTVMFAALALLGVLWLGLLAVAAAVGQLQEDRMPALAEKVAPPPDNPLRYKFVPARPAAPHTCPHPQHEPPPYLYIAPGCSYAHVCPGCGAAYVLHGETI